MPSLFIEANTFPVHPVTKEPQRCRPSQDGTVMFCNFTKRKKGDGLLLIYSATIEKMMHFLTSEQFRKAFKKRSRPEEEPDKIKEPPTANGSGSLKV